MKFHPATPPPHPGIVLDAWRTFIRSGQIDSAVRPQIQRAWTRSRNHGCSPYMPRAELLSPSETIALLKRESRLVEIASPFLGALSRAAGGERHAAMLGDAEGRVLKIVADAETASDEQFPRAGSLLSEASAGANGIGTALADGHYVELVGPEHFIEGFHSFTCQGVPLYTGPRDAIGVISMSVRRIETADRIRDILFCASEAAECELLSAHFSRLLLRPEGTDAVLEELRQDIVQRIASARFQLEFAARRIASGQTASDLLLDAERLIDRFRRQAGVWRNLVDDSIGSPEPVAVHDLVVEFTDLLQTEARINGVTLHADQIDPVLALDDIRALTRRLLSAVLNSLQRAARGSTLHVSIGVDAARKVVSVTTQGIDQANARFQFQVDAPALS
jgi:transcriptional regulator of acetoin/glycerol metabolism